MNDVPHFFCEIIKGEIRWRLSFPTNDPLALRQNLWQAASQRANCDFSPLFDHHSAVEYSLK